MPWEKYPSPVSTTPFVLTGQELQNPMSINKPSSNKFRFDWASYLALKPWTKSHPRAVGIVGLGLKVHTGCRTSLIMKGVSTKRMRKSRRYQIQLRVDPRESGIDCPCRIHAIFVPWLRKRTFPASWAFVSFVFLYCVCSETKPGKRTKRRKPRVKRRETCSNLLLQSVS